MRQAAPEFRPKARRASPEQTGSFLVSPLASLNSPGGNNNAITLVLRQAEALVNEWSGR